MIFFVENLVNRLLVNQDIIKSESGENLIAMKLEEIMRVIVEEAITNCIELRLESTHILEGETFILK